MGAAISGLEAQQTMLNTTASNLANVDTVGYKSQETSFVDALSQTIAGGSNQTAANAGTDPEQVGLGVSVGAIVNNMGQGSDQATGIATDLAIQGNGFFQVAASTSATGGATTNNPAAGPPPPANGPVLDPTQIEYTRAGNFQVSPNGYLTTQGGQYVVGIPADPTSGAPVNPTNASGQNTQGSLPIQIPSDASDIAIGKNGEVTYSQAGTQKVAGYIQLANFNNDAGLSRDGGSLWSATTASGQAQTFDVPGGSGLGSVASGELESSNVDMATEFANMIDAQNGYQADSKVMTTANQMLQTLVQMPA
ncbi:MAG TPA: flagellar hook-basal body complex protein [Solirubrobacteraceae bacterium]|nr:flagellar hook-basal body complex protein [Solirubrobacteraceae bacterium]